MGDSPQSLVPSPSFRHQKAPQGLVALPHFRHQELPQGLLPPPPYFRHEESPAVVTPTLEPLSCQRVLPRPGATVRVEALGPSHSGLKKLTAKTGTLVLRVA